MTTKKSSVSSSEFLFDEIKILDESIEKTNGLFYDLVNFDQTDYLPRVKGKFIYIGDNKMYIRGVTYGAFKPNVNGDEYHDLEKIHRDFAQMVKYGINTVRIPHTTPPRILLDIAHHYGLKVMIGLSAEQYVGYLIDKNKDFDIEKIILEKVRICKNHPALLCISLGNEIPSSIVRWIGHKKVERYLKRLYLLVKNEFPESIVTYVNYPTTEYLQLSFLDLLCFNVYLEKQSDYENYLYRLQNIAGNRPLLMGEIGLDCIRNGEEMQAKTLEWQIQSTFSCGCVGLFIFSWTDEWYRGEEEVYDWAFGLTTKDREPKPALQTIHTVFNGTPFQLENNWPKISVIVCSHNGSKTLKKCFEGLIKMNYPNYEVIFINDGSTDDSLSIATKLGIESYSIKNMGLSYARNLGIQKSDGEIIAYTDDDAFPDPDWLFYLAIEFRKTDFAAIGGPNISPENSGFISECVNNAPGSPTHVLYSDRIAEHIPGCNMAFKRDKLLEIGGFDPQFRTAGDDVDACWRLQENGDTIGFSAAAMVWHYRRNSIKTFWKQQYGYGKAEALLEKKWPKKYNNYGHRAWGGKLYGDGTAYLSFLNKSRIYSGIWGSAPFQSIYEVGGSSLFSVVFMPEWHIICVGLFGFSLFGLLWKPLLISLPIFIAFTLIPIGIIIRTVKELNPSILRGRGWFFKKKFQILTIILYMIQPLARLMGRIKNNLTPWRRYNKSFSSLKIYGKKSIWSEKWISHRTRLKKIEDNLKKNNSYVYRGGLFDSWDLAIKGGAFGGIKIIMATEDHAKGTQYIRFRFFPRISSLSKYLISFISIIIVVAIIDNSLIALFSFSLLLVLAIIRIYLDCSSAVGCFKKAIEKQIKAYRE